MKLRGKKLGVALGALLGLGAAGQASADVYGVSYLDIDNITVLFLNEGGGIAGGGAGAFTFSTNQDAILNGAPDLSSGNASCAGVFPVFNNCAAGSPRLSGTVQNAPPAPGAATRGESDYTLFGQVAQYSNAEAEITSALLVGDATTGVELISESNLAGSIDGFHSAQANSLVNSNTALNLTFGPAGGVFSISFDAYIDVMSEVTDDGPKYFGLAQANSGVTVLLQKGGVTVASWAPTGNNNVTSCGAGYVCTAVETGPSLNNTTSSTGAANQVVGSGRYSLTVTGLTSGQYTLALAATTSTDLFRIVPVPGTLLLMGTGLLLCARTRRHNRMY